MNGLIYVHRISDPRTGGTSKRNVRLFKELCGDNSLRNVCIATTNWDRVSEEEGNRWELQLRESPNIFKPLINEGAQLARHDQGIISARSIVNFLIHKDPTKLQIQIELDAGMSLEETSTGAGLLEEILALKAKQKAEMQALKEEMEAAAREKHAELLAELEEERQQREVQRKKMEEDLENLKMQARSDMMKHKEEIRRLEDKTAMEVKQLEAKLLSEREAREELERNSREHPELLKHEEKMRRLEDKTAMDVKQLEAKLLAEREAREELERNNRERPELLKHEERMRRLEDKMSMDVTQTEAELLAEREALEQNNRERLELLKHEEKIRRLEDKVTMDAEQRAAELLAERKAREELERKLRELMEQQAQRDRDKYEADIRNKRMEAGTEAPAEQAQVELAKNREREPLPQVKLDKKKLGTTADQQAQRDKGKHEIGLRNRRIKAPAEQAQAGLVKKREHEHLEQVKPDKEKHDTTADRDQGGWGIIGYTFRYFLFYYPLTF